MKINLSFDVSDQDRRRVRAAISRGGVATRREIRIFAERAVRGAIAGAPEPKSARRTKSPAEPIVTIDGVTKSLGSHTWDPTPEALQRIADLAERSGPPFPPGTYPAKPKRLTLEQLQALPDDARCALCSRPKDEHGRMGLTCPPRSGHPYGRRFTPAAGVL